MLPILPLALMAGGGMLAKGLGGLYAGNQQRIAARDQQRAIQRAQGAITDAYGKAQGYQQPYLQAGQVGLGRMMDGNYDVNVPQYQRAVTPGPYQAEQFNFEADPGYAYRLKTGQEAVQSGAAAQGQGLSGSTLKALARFGSELGSQEHANAFDRYMRGRGQSLAEYQTNLGAAERAGERDWGGAKDIYSMGAEQAQRRYGRAADLGTMGERAAGNLSDMATNQGSNLASLYGTGGQISAANRMARAQNAINTIGGMADTGMDALTLGYLGQGGGAGGVIPRLPRGF